MLSAIHPVSKDCKSVLLNSFHLICHTLGFYSRALKLEPSCTAYYTAQNEDTNQMVTH